MFRPAAEIREEFLRFFEERGHRRVRSSSVVPDSDPTLMFVNAGMVQFKRVFLGEENRNYSRATTSQKCIRVSGKHNDLENVGRTPRHHTFFEMLGNFSFGDYFKDDAIDFAWELLTSKLGYDSENLAVSVFREDDEAADIWGNSIGLPEEKIFRLDEKENFWTMGDTGPCGPCSEIHYDFGRPDTCTSLVCDPSCECGRWLEVWNLVFMQFNRDASGTMTPLPKPSIDTGGGLERWAAISQGVRSNYETDLFHPLLERAQELSGVTLGQDVEKDVSLRVAADHARTLAFMICDGVLPSNLGRGYVLRRILRRGSRHGVLLGLDRTFLHDIADAVIEQMGGVYPELVERRQFIVDRIRSEEERFLKTLSKGLKILEEEIEISKQKGAAVLDGRVAFKLYDTYGFPLDLTQDILVSHDMGVDVSDFDEEMQSQKKRARAAWAGSGDEGVSEVYGPIALDVTTQFLGYESLEHTAQVVALVVDGQPVDEVRAGQQVEVIVEETPFYAESGGQVGDRGLIATATGQIRVEDTQKPVDGLFVHKGRVEEGQVTVDTEADLQIDRERRAATVRNHTGTHLLHAALREVIGSQSMQKGSLVGPDRLRFDFTHDSPLTKDQIFAIEDRVNEWIESNTTATTRLMGYEEAVAEGAIAIFDEKYGDQVRVISFGDCSTELCGGTHAKATGDLGLLKIISETGVAAGVRRIEALTGIGAFLYLREEESHAREAADLLKVSLPDLSSRVERLLQERKELEKELKSVRSRQRGSEAGDLLSGAKEIKGVNVLAVHVHDMDAKAMRSMVDDLRNRLGTSAVLVASEQSGKALLAVGVTKDVMDRLKAGELIRHLAALVGGKGGGRPDFAQAGGRDASGIPSALEDFYRLCDAG